MQQNQPATANILNDERFSPCLFQSSRMQLQSRNILTTRCVYRFERSSFQSRFLIEM